MSIFGGKKLYNVKFTCKIFDVNFLDANGESNVFWSEERFGKQKF